jgi:hypothetical protein
MRMPMLAITTKNSLRVKAERLRTERLLVQFGEWEGNGAVPG